MLLRFMVIVSPIILFFVVLFLNSCTELRLLNSQLYHTSATKTLIIDTQREPASPLNLVLTVELFAEQKEIMIQGQVQKDPAYPAEAFTMKKLRGRIEVPPGLNLIKSNAEWDGEKLAGTEVKNFTKSLRIVAQEGRWNVMVWIAGSPSNSIDSSEEYSDIETFFVFAQDKVIDISADPFPSLGPGTGVGE